METIWILYAAIVLAFVAEVAGAIVIAKRLKRASGGGEV